MKIKLLSFFLFSSLFAFAQQNLSLKKLNTIDSLSLQDVMNGGPGIATGIVVNGNVMYQKYAGYANLADSTLITSKSRFNIASNAKQFTAFAILNLVEAGKLKLSDDVRKFIPKLLPNVKEKVSISNLLNHSSGIRDVYDLWSLQGIVWWKNTFNNQDAVDLLTKQKELNFSPGSQYLYSNSNYILLAQVIEKVSGTTFINFTNILFRKLGMPNTSFVDNYTLIAPPVALPYFNFDKWTGYNWICNIRGDGNLFSTLADQLHWEVIIQTKKSKYFSTKLLAKTQQLIEASQIKNYGYGLEFATYKGINYNFHEGSTGAWKATILRFPEQKLSIVTLTNSGKAIPAMQSRQVADILLGKVDSKPSYLIKPLSIGEYVNEKDLVGTYLTDDNFSFRFELKDSTIYLKRFGRNDIKLVRESANVFHQWNDPAFKQEFKCNAAHEMVVTAYYTSHAPYSLKKIKTQPSANLNELAGKFYNEEVGAYLSLVYQKDQSYLLNIGNTDDEAILVGDKLLLTTNYSILISDNLNEILLSGDRIKKIKFKRVE